VKIFTASLATETNTFSPMPTDRALFEDSFYKPAGTHPESASFFGGPLHVLRRRARRGELALVEGLHTYAYPAGLTVRRVYEEFRDTILDELKRSMPVDAVILGLHGAMAAEGYEDCEGDMLARVRDIVGFKIPVGAELDPHCHLTDPMVANADALVMFKEFPHTDFVERAEELVEIVLAAARGEAKPTMSVFDCRMIQIMRTTMHPMRGFVDKIKSMEGKNGVMSISVGHGFAFADVRDVGAKILVVTDGRKADGDRLAETLGRELFSLRDRLAPPLLSIESALDAALATPGQPIVIAEPADNAGGGAPSDSTYFLDAMLKRGLRRAAFAPVFDPIAVKQCLAAGEGASFDLRFGGKLGVTSGRPIDGRIKVLRTVRDASQTFGDTKFPIGDAAGIEIDGIGVVLTASRVQAYHPDLFANLGIDPLAQKILVVKSTNHFHAGFGSVAKSVLYSDGPGALPGDPRRIAYSKLDRKLWPMHSNPFEETP
jgi:microcystin degradation protein MlrC